MASAPAGVFRTALQTEQQQQHGPQAAAAATAHDSSSSNPREQLG
jgi:hypothetical protein